MNAVGTEGQYLGYTLELISNREVLYILPRSMVCTEFKNEQKQPFRLYVHLQVPYFDIIVLVSEAAISCFLIFLPYL